MMTKTDNIQEILQEILKCYGILSAEDHYHAEFSRISQIFLATDPVYVLIIGFNIQQN